MYGTRFGILLAFIHVLFAVFASTAAQAQTNPDILILGDSQISFSAGGPYLDFFGNLEQQCGTKPRHRRALKRLGDSNVAAIGVRSTSLHSWTARGGARKDTICAVDKKYGVNAAAFGINGDPKRRFVQIGKGRAYQFCEPRMSPLESVLRDGYYDPKLVIFALLGNGAKRWAEDPAAALEDVDALARQLPEDVGCVFMSTAPVYAKKTNDLRARAQTNIQTAFERGTQQCAFVAGFSPETRNAIEGRPEYFARRSDGSVKDPLHPNIAAIRLFLNMKTPEICDAVLDALKQAK